MAALPEASVGEGWKVLRELAAVSVVRHQATVEATKQSVAATYRANSAQASEAEAVLAARDLLTALMQGAGSDRSAPSLAEALEAARQVLAP